MAATQGEKVENNYIITERTRGRGGGERVNSQDETFKGTFVS